MDHPGFIVSNQIENFREKTFSGTKGNLKNGNLKILTCDPSKYIYTLYIMDHPNILYHAGWINLSVKKGLKC